jgi:hypothetical protein
MAVLDHPLKTHLAGIYTGNQVAGLVGAGQKVTAVGGFVFDRSANGIAGATVKLFTSNVGVTNCDSTTGFVASDVTSADGFYFIWKTGTDQVNGTTVLPSGTKYYVTICYNGGISSARYIDHKLDNKEFDEEDFYIVAPY